MLRIRRTLASGKRRTALEIAESEQIPLLPNKVFKKLKRAGMIRLTGGAEGG